MLINLNGDKMVYCVQCGKKILEGSKYCEGCGKKVSDNKTAESNKSSKKRPTFLNVWLGLLIINYILGIIININSGLIISVILGGVGLFFVYRLYNWYKSGFYGTILPC